MLLWALSFTTTMSLAKGLDPCISTIVLVFLRCAFGFLFSVPFVLKEGIQFLLQTKRIYLHLLRVLFYCSAMASTYYAYRNLPLAEACAIGFTGPLMTTLLAAFILREHVSLQKWLCIIGGYLGVLVIINPTGLEINHAVYVLLWANLSASAALICTKKLSSTENPWTILTYTNTASLIITSMIAIPAWQSPDLQDALLLIGMGCCGIISQFSYINALKLGKPSFLSPFEYTRLVISIPIGFFIFSETPSLRTLIGSVMVMGMTYLLTCLDAKEEKEDQNNPS